MKPVSLLILASLFACRPIATETDDTDSDADTDADTDSDTDSDTDADTDSDTDSDTDTDVEDADDDGHFTPQDCDDADPDVHPGASEVCENGKDDDCDGTVNGCGWDGDYALPDVGYTLEGHRTNDTANARVAAGFDADGDGQDDLILGGSTASEGATYTGLVYIVRGPIAADGGLSTIAAAKLTGSAAEDQAGWGLDFIGDVDADGAAELAISFLGSQQASNSAQAARVFVLSGDIEGSHEIADVAAEWTPESTYDSAGYDIDGTDDVTGDGVPDLLVGAPFMNKGGSLAGAAYVVDGATAKDGGALGSAKGRIYGSTMNLQLGSSVSGPGDIDGDGLADVVIGARGYYDAVKHIYPGAMYVFFGPLTGTASDTTADATLYGVANSVELLARPDMVVGPGDVDGDGTGDLLVASPYEQSGAGGNGGTVYLYSGAAISGESSLLLSQAVVTGTGDQLAGFGVTGTGDLDGDGANDVLVGAQGDDAYGSFTGAAFLFYGPTLSGNVALDAYDAAFYGDNAGWAAGRGLAAGELSGDGLVDLVITAPSAPGEVDYAGLTFVLPSAGW